MTGPQHDAEEPQPSVEDRDGYWHEYDVGLFGRLARSLGHVLLAAGIGVAMTFGVVLLGGVLAEEGLVPELATPIDLLGRMSLAVILGGACLGFVLLAGARWIDGAANVRALERAAQEGNDARAVPHPGQVESVVLRSDALVIGVLAVHAVVAVVAAIFGLTYDEPLIGLGAVLVAILCAMGCFFVARIDRRGSRARIADHFTAHVEQTAWARARRADQSAVDATATQRRGTWVRGRLLITLGTVLSVLSAMVLKAYIYTRHPGTEGMPGQAGELGERVDYSEGAETLLAYGLWTAAALGVVAILLCGAGAFLEAVASRTECAALMRRLDDPLAKRPPKELLARYAEPHAVDLARVAAGLGGFLLAPAVAVIILAVTDNDTFGEAYVLFADLRPHAFVGVAVAVVLIVGAWLTDAIGDARGLRLRNQLLRRWPTVPEKPDNEDPAYAVRTGPSLRTGL